MPLHDWTRVDAGIFHSFHLSWIGEMVRVLNNGLLPEEYSALGEQVTSGGNPDVLTLQSSAFNVNGSHGDAAEGPGGGLLTVRPATRLTARSDAANYTSRQRQIAIRHRSGDRVVALIEIVSPGNKASAYPWQTFVEKMTKALRLGVHLLILDPHPPSPRDPGGVHGAIWGEVEGGDYRAPADADRTLAAYAAGPLIDAYVEPVAVGQELRAMPLFLTPGGGYVEVPLEATYRAAFEGVPPRYRRELA